MSDSCSSTFARPMAAALSRARCNIAAVMSTPMTRPAWPAICAATSRSVPAPHPRSTTVSPGAMRPSENGSATPTKLSTLASGIPESSGCG